MMKRNSAAILVILAAATMWGQSSAGPRPTRHQAVVATSNAEGVAASVRAKAAATQQMEEMGATLAKMHALLKQMRAKATSAKDPMAKANLDMWALMLEQLDKQYEQLSAASRARQDLESRRAAMYKQADQKAAAAAQAAREAQKAAPADSNASSQPSAAPAAAQTTPTTPASATSPN